MDMLDEDKDGQNPAGYNPKSCSPLEKAHYTPLEAAIRWCGLMDHEAEILAAAGHIGYPLDGQFPQWPCLKTNTEKIIDAIRHGELPYGRDGKAVRSGEHVRVDRLTVRHADLRKWMADYYPDQKPPFLFDEVERKTHAAINTDAFLALQAERDALKAKLAQAREWARTVLAEKRAMSEELKALQAKVGKGLTPTERNTLLIIIEALCEYAGIDPQERGAARRIMEMTDRLGAHVDDDTIRAHLAKIPDALESRMK